MKMKGLLFLLLVKNAAGIYCSYADLFNIDSCKAIGDCCGFSYQCESYCCTNLSVCGTSGNSVCQLTIGE